MRIERIAMVVAVWLTLVSGGWSAELIDVTSAVDKQTAFVGDLIAYSITITYDSTIILTPPSVGANLGGFDVKDYEVGEETRLEDGRRRQALQFQIRTFTTGEYVIPPLLIEYMLPDSTRKQITADPIKINVKSVLAEGTAADTLKPKPLKGQASLERERPIAYIIGAAALLIAAAAVIIYFRRRKAKSEQALADLRPAWEVAFARLAVLKEKNLPAQDEVKLFYIELSEIFRAYLGKHYVFNAIDLTTSEIGDFLTSWQIPADLVGEIVPFLEHADLVKFAKYVPPASRPDLDWQTAYDLVTRSKDIFAVPPVTESFEPVAVGVGVVPPGNDNPELKYAPPELRPSLTSNNEEERP